MINYNNGYNPIQMLQQQRQQIEQQIHNLQQQAQQFQQQYPQQFSSQPYQQQVQNPPSMIWVEGDAGAKSYLVAPGTTIPLWDSEANIIYVKSTDEKGIPSTKVLRYEVVEDGKSKIQNQLQSNNPNLSEYVKKQEIGAYIEQFLAQREMNHEKSIISTSTEAATDEGHTN